MGALYTKLDTTNLSSNQARIKLSKAYNNQTNFMTPSPVEYGRAGPYAYEISVGTGIRRERIYGVTVIDWHTLEKQFDKSGCVYSMAEAYELLNGLAGD